jgi:sigma-E factor negative regulatory protein RseA
MEKISALMDGELDGQQAQQQIQSLRDDPELASGWHTFHLIGDAIRNERPLSRDFSRRVSSRIAAEPTVVAPRRSSGKRAVAFALSAAASLSAVALVAWVALSTVPPASAPEIARAPISPPTAIPASATPSAAAPSLASVPSDGTMNEYLMAHQEFSPSTALQGVAPYIRSVSITRQAQGR